MRLILPIFLSLITFLSVAQQPKVDLTSPYDAIYTHLYYLQPESYDDSLAAQPFNPDRRTLDVATQSAIKLKRILDGKGLYIYMDEIPKQNNFYDSINHHHKFILIEEYPQIFLLRLEDGNWYFSDSSINEIDKLYEETFRFGTGRLLNLLPRLGTQKVLGLYMYQYIAILVLAFISVLLLRLFSVLSERIIRKALVVSGYGETSQKYLRLVAKPTSVFVVTFLLIVFTPALQLPPGYTQYVVVVLKVMLPLFGTIILYRMINILAVYLNRLASRTDNTLDDQLVPLLRKTLKAFVVIIGTLFILNNLSIPIFPLLTGLSIGGLAFALAAQDTIKNFFGSIMIFIDKPFQAGDWITTGGIDGTVEEVGFRSSRIRTFRNSLVYVPNGKLADSTIDNHGLRKYRRFYTQITIMYDTPPELIEKFIEGLREIVKKHPYTWKDNYHIYFNDMAAFSLNIMFYIFFKLPTWGEELQARHEVLMGITRLAKELGINFAFPTQTLHIENLPGQPSLSPSYPNEEETNRAFKDFFRNET